MSSAISFNLDQSKILLSGTGLTLSQRTNFRLLQSQPRSVSAVGNDFISYQPIFCMPKDQYRFPSSSCHLMDKILLTLSQTSPGFCVCSIILLKTLWEKEELLVMSNFTFSHSVFYPFGELAAIFIQFKMNAFFLTRYFF